MRKICMLLMAALLFSRCNKEKFFDGPDFYQDGFESYSSLSDLLLPDDQRWSLTQITNDANNITVDTTHVHAGNKSMKFTAKKSGNSGASKCSLMKHNMAFWSGETVRLTA